MLTFHLARRSLTNRLLTSGLTLSSIALSVALLVGVENVRTGMRESFSNTISRTDLIVGPRTGTLQLLLYSVFGMGSPTGNLSHESYEHWAQHPAVEWTIPYALGDSHRGFRVIGTDTTFYARYRYRGGQELALAAGRVPTELYDLALGADVATELGYALGDSVAVTHGMGGFMDHGDKPFVVQAILEKTFTPVDRAIYTTLAGLAAVHLGWESGAPPMPGEEVHAHEAEELHEHGELELGQITSFFVGVKSRQTVLQLQRDINTWPDEPMTAVIPGLALAELWRGIGFAENGLQVVTLFVVVVGLLGMVVSLYTSLEARRREMAILRAVGAGPRQIVALLVLESGLLATGGAVIGLGLVYALLLALQPWVEGQFGLYLPIAAPGATQLAYVGAVIVIGFVMGLVPALKAYRTALHDGLAVKV